MILPGAFRAATGDTPASMRATSTPAPVYPAFHHAAAPEYEVVFAIEFMSAAGSYPSAPAGTAVTARPVTASTMLASVVATARRRSGRRPWSHPPDGGCVLFASRFLMVACSPSLRSGSISV